LALILRSLVKLRFLFGWRHFDHFKFALLGLLHAPAQCFTEDRPTPIDLAQAGVAAALGDGGQAIEPLDIVEFLGQCLRRKGLDAHAGPGADRSLGRVL